MGKHVLLVSSNQKGWHQFTVPDLNAFRYIMLSRTTTNGSSRGNSITTLRYFKSHKSGSLTFSIDDTDTTLAYYVNDTTVGVYTSREDRVSLLSGIK